MGAGKSRCEDVAKAMAAPAAENASHAQKAVVEPDVHPTQTAPTADEQEEKGDEEEDEEQEADREALEAECAELRRTRQQLLQARVEVRATIARFASSFEDTSPCNNAPIEELHFDRGHNADSHPDHSDHDEEASEHSQYDSEGSDVPEVRSLQCALEERDDLEDEVESLRESLEKASVMIASIVQKSNEWSEHLDGVQQRVQLPATTQLKLHTNVTSDTSFDTAPVPKVVIKPLNFKKPKPENLKLQPLDFLSAPSQPGSSEAGSSSTATPRSEKSSESRMASARSDINPCWREQLEIEVKLCA